MHVEGQRWLAQQETRQGYMRYEGTGVYLPNLNFRQHANTNATARPSQQGCTTSSSESAQQGLAMCSEELSSCSQGLTSGGAAPAPAVTQATAAPASRSSLECSTPPASMPASSSSSSVQAPETLTRRSTFPGVSVSAALSACGTRHSFDQSWVGTRGNRRSMDWTRANRAGRSSPLPTIMQQQQLLQQPPPPPPPRAVTSPAAAAVAAAGGVGPGAGAVQQRADFAAGRQRADGVQIPAPPGPAALVPAGSGDFAGSVGSSLQRWAVVADPSSSSNSSSSSTVTETLAQLRARLAAARTAATSDDSSASLISSGSLLDAAADRAGSSAGITLPSPTAAPSSSAMLPSSNIALLLQQLQLNQHEQQQHQQQQQRQQALLARQAPGPLAGGGRRSCSPNPFPSKSLLPYGASSPMLQAGSAQAARASSLSAPLRLLWDAEVQGGAGVSAQVGHIPADGGLDVAALAASAVQEKLAEMQDLEGRYKQLSEEVLALLPLI